MRKKRILIFGGAGFIGSHVAIECLKKGYSVSIYDTEPVEPPLSKDVEVIIGDILDEKSVNNVVSKADIVYNFAGIPDLEDCIKHPVNAIKYNILGNTIILDACKNHKIERFIFASSLYAHSNSGGIYSSTKNASESIIKDYQKYHGVKYTILQYGTVYGVGAEERNSVYRYLKQALTNGKIKYAGDGSETREYIHVIDAAKLSVKILEKKYENKTVIITGHHPIKVKDLFDMINEMLGGNVKIEYKTKVSKEKKKSHYKITPYSYYKDTPYKLVTDFYMDLGKGMTQILEAIEEEAKKR